MVCHFHLYQQNLNLFFYHHNYFFKRKLNSQKDEQIIRKVMSKIFDAILKEIQKQLLSFIIDHKICLEEKKIILILRHKLNKFKRKKAAWHAGVKK